MSEFKKSHVYNIWNYSMDLKGTQLTIRGHSRGSEQSCFYISELKLHLDAGIGGYYNPNYIFVTHCHSDHSFQLPMILTGLNRDGKNPPCIFVPKESKHLFENFLHSTYELRKGSDRIRGYFRVTGLMPGQEVDLKKEGYFVRVYNMHHNVPTRGYGVCQRRKKLNSQFYGLFGWELKALKDSGIDINVYEEHKMIAYVLDTNIKCFETNPELLKYRYVMVECTFFLGDSKNEMDGDFKYHIHWLQLKPIIKNNPDVHFILIHFSMRYTWDEIGDFFEKQKNELPNITAWMN